jgi:hypothetical protein
MIGVSEQFEQGGALFREKEIVHLGFDLSRHRYRNSGNRLRPEAAETAAPT